MLYNSAALSSLLAPQGLYLKAANNLKKEQEEKQMIATSPEKNGMHVMLIILHTQLISI
jgi:hypothetical protein